MLALQINKCIDAFSLDNNLIFYTLNKTCRKQKTLAILESSTGCEDTRAEYSIS